jgi:cell wall-associated NlpC family hydrolase
MKRAMKKLAGKLAVCLLAAAALLCLHDAWARPTSPEQARSVAQNWLAQEARPMGANLGRQIKEVQTFYDEEGNPSYFVVFLNPGGLIIVSADDLVEPIIGFVSDATSFDPSPTDPLGGLVSRDLAGRVLKAREMESLAREMGRAPAMATPQSRAREKWAWLEHGVPFPTLGAGKVLPIISDVRVAALVQTQWSQGRVDIHTPLACYNYYTPPNDAGHADNYVCGCVATAMSQIMRFWQHPVAGVGTATFKIKVADVDTTRSLRGGNGAGGPYLWKKMPLTTGVATTLIQRRAIGALTADAGVSVNMSYNSGGSGSSTSYAAYALVNTFKYANAIAASGNNSNIPDGHLHNMLNTNLDAGFPTQLGIAVSSTGAGHSIVCDGYGYNSATLYHHLNLGWHGKDDAWYNLPTIDTSQGTFDTVTAAIYNIYKTGSGEIISGRVTAAGAPLGGVLITATRGRQIFRAITNLKGIYALPKLPSNATFNIRATKNGYRFPPKAVTTGKSVNSVSAPDTPGDHPQLNPSTVTGNRWGVDFADLSPDQYVSPYKVWFACNYNLLTYDFNQTPRNDITKQSSLDYSEWYDLSNPYYAIGAGNPQSSCSTGSPAYSATATWGPQSRQYPAVTAPISRALDSVTWKRERLIAVAMQYLGYNYQHHHIPDFDPYDADPTWPASCPPVLVSNPTAGIDCSNFSSWNYNYGLGIKLNSALPDQSFPATPIPGPGGKGFITPQVIGRGMKYGALRKILRTGDLLYIRKGPGQAVSHVIMWLGYMGVDSKEGFPLVIDSHDNAPAIVDSNRVTIPPGVQLRPFRPNEWYFREFSHALRIIR